MADEFNTEAFTLLGIGVLVVAVRTASRLTITGIKGLWLEYVLHDNPALEKGLQDH
jgi:hypothetical protein